MIPPTETGDRSSCSAVAELDTCPVGTTEWYITLQPYDFMVQFLSREGQAGGRLSLQGT